ncbi:MAG TPA: polysaccharide biosynthesis protein, partial [Lachnospiraceae bacterium]|nr:polysaccharide biosynthesis protein [Lachnospiraceae bacterium]
MINKIKSGRLNYKKLILLAIDILVIILSSYGGLLVRFDLVFERILPAYRTSVNRYVLINVLLTVTIFYLFRLYHSLWSYASAVELQNIFGASVLSSALVCIGMLILGLKVPRSYYFNYGSLLFFMTLANRFSYRLARFYLHKIGIRRSPRNIMMIGAGAAASVIMREIQGSVHINNSKVRCIIDDAKEKQGRFMHGAKIVGTREDIIACAEEYHIDEIIIAIPSASKKTISELVSICKKIKCELRILPGIYQLMNGEVSVHKLRKVDIEDLLGREPIKADMDSIMGYVQGKVCLVTGGGGSIGSELCRQIAQHGPRQLIIIDNYENNAYEIQQELKRTRPELNLVVLIATVRD